MDDGRGNGPAGMRVNLRPRSKIQPMLFGHGGYMFSTHQIPTRDAGAFNFRFDVGAGFEVFRTRSRSLRLEYRLQHVSDKDSSWENPGIDSQVLHVAYIVGR